MSRRRPTTSVVICAYTLERWDDLRAAIDSVRRQRLVPEQLLVVVDHAPELLDRLAGTGVTALPNAGPRGLSGARNTGVHHATGDVVVFLDDDAVAEPDWLEQLIDPFDDPGVLGVGGLALADWDTARPRWFPPEFDWVVGCSYEGLPTEQATVRNLIGCTMAIRRRVFDAVGGFSSDLGRVGTRPVGCEETEFCIRATRELGGRFVHQPRAVVHHRVRPARATGRYFVSRCHAEGLSKAMVARLVGSRSALSSEATHARRALLAAVGRDLHRTARGDLHALTRIGAIGVGAGAATVGLVRGRVTGRVPPPATVPTEVRTVDLDGAVPCLAGPARVRCLVRLDRAPIAYVDVDVPADGLGPTELAHALRSRLPGRCDPHHVDDDRSPVPPAARPATVVIATRDRPESLRTCLRSVGRLDTPPAQVIVVDSAPTTDAARAVVETEFGDTVEYVRSDRPGLAIAHNVALERVRGEVVAFTDDDVVVDPGWLDAISRAFDDPAVGCVTGLIAPLELRTTAQHWIEDGMGLQKGFRTRRFDLADHRPDDRLFPFTAGTMGSGANMAFHTETLRRLGGFDGALGAGRRSRGGDDLAAFHDVVAAGHQVVYEPSAIVHHRHHDTPEAVRRTAYGYGAGLGAFVTRTLVDDPRRALHALRVLPAGVARAVGSGASTTDDRDGLPRSFRAIQLLGLLVGPVGYVRARREDRRERVR